MGSRREACRAMTNSATYIVCRSCQERLRIRGQQNAACWFAHLDDVSQWLDRHRGCSASHSRDRAFDFVDELGERTLAGTNAKPSVGPAGLSPDLDAIIDAVVSLAEVEVLTSGRIEPFAAALYRESRMVILADNQEGEEIAPDEVAACLTRYLRARAADGLLRAGALCEHRAPRDEAGAPESIRVRAEYPGGDGLSVEIPLLRTPASVVAFGPRISRPIEAETRLIGP